MANRDIPEINAGSMADIAFLLLIFFLVTTTMDKDAAYVRNIPKKIEVVVTDPVVVEERNICAIQANNKNQLMVRGELMSNPDDISVRVVEFYQMNEAQNDPTNNFPMYSRITMEKIDENISIAEAAAEAVEETPDASQDIIDFKWKQVAEWEAKKSALNFYSNNGSNGKNELPEIHFQAHIRIEVMQETAYELFAKIQSEIEEAIFELRDGAAEDVFNESYGTITARYAMNQEAVDKEKIDLLKILYPDRFIEVTPKR